MAQKVIEGGKAGYASDFERESNGPIWIWIIKNLHSPQREEDCKYIWSPYTFKNWAILRSDNRSWVVYEIQSRLKTLWLHKFYRRQISSVVLVLIGQENNEHYVESLLIKQRPRRRKIRLKIISNGFFLFKDFLVFTLCLVTLSFTMSIAYSLCELAVEGPRLLQFLGKSINLS